MRIKVFATTLLLSMVFLPALAGAQTVTQCQEEIAVLKGQAQQVSITGQKAEKDRAGLVGTLDAASLELNKAKFCDAIKKLNDFKVKVNQSVAAGRINTDPNAGTTAQDLLTGADSAIACLQGLVTNSNTVCP